MEIVDAGGEGEVVDAVVEEETTEVEVGRGSCILVVEEA